MRGWTGRSQLARREGLVAGAPSAGASYVRSSDVSTSTTRRSSCAAALAPLTHPVTLHRAATAPLQRHRDPHERTPGNAPERPNKGHQPTSDNHHAAERPGTAAQAEKRPPTPRRGGAAAAARPRALHLRGARADMLAGGDLQRAQVLGEVGAAAGARGLRLAAAAAALARLRRRMKIVSC